jgi:hypothetical protein
VWHIYIFIVWLDYIWLSILYMKNMNIYDYICLSYLSGNIVDL